MSDATAAAEAAQPTVAAEAPAATTEETKPEAVAEATAEEKTEEKTEEKAEEEAEEKEAPAEKKEEASKAPAKNGKDAKNSKFDPSVLPVSEDHTAIQTQVHFYFSDSNLPTDKYMWELTGGSENKPVPVKKITQFGRMRRFKSYETVVAALRASKFLVLGNADKPGEETVARKTAYNPDRPRGKTDAATIYAKGFGEEEATTQFDLEAYFKQFGPVNCVRLRRAADNLFKGSVFVEFQDAETAEAFLKREPAPQWQGTDLKIMSKAAYVAEKSQLIREGKIEPSNNSAPRFYEGRTVGGRRGGRGNGAGKFDKDDWKKRRDDDRKNGFRGGRGGRGGGRGGRGGGRGRGGRGGRGHWDNNRNGRSQENGKPAVQATNDKGDAVKTDAAAAAAPAENTSAKRGREDDGASEPPAKKLDTKPAAVEAA